MLLEINFIGKLSRVHGAQTSLHGLRMMMMLMLLMELLVMLMLLVAVLLLTQCARLKGAADGAGGRAGDQMHLEQSE